MDSKNKIRLFFVLEILLWVVIITFCVGFVRIHNIQKTKEYKTYSIFLQDIDGLIEGSSIRMMGVPIGYVKTINIVQDQVYIKFVVTDKNINIPQGSIATVEFNGMAGSKSLEIYPPNEVSKASGKLIEIKKTNRLGAALGLFDDMFAKLDSIIIRCNYFSSEVESILPQKEILNNNTVKSEEPEKMLSITCNFIEKLNKQRNKFMNKFNPQRKEKNNNDASDDNITEVN